MTDPVKRYSENGLDMHQWAFATRTFSQMHGHDEGSTGIDDEFAARGFQNVGAWIIARNMSGPIRGPWPDDQWKGWWGDNPPYHVPVFVLTHHARAPIEMAGDTTFHFVTDGIRAVPSRGVNRRNASGDLAGAARQGRESLQRYRRAKAGISLHRARPRRVRHVCCTEQMKRTALF